MRLHLFVPVLGAFLGCIGAHAATIDFSGAPSSGTPLTTYTESGYTVANSSGQWYFVDFFGNPAPSIYASTTSSITVTDAGSLFDFSSVDLVNDVDSASYTFAGYDGATEVYSVSGSIPTDPSGSGVFRTYDSGEGSVDITSLVITITGATDDPNIDNIVVNAAPVATTPEPSTIGLLGTGLLGFAGLLRRRRAV